MNLESITQSHTYGGVKLLEQLKNAQEKGYFAFVPGPPAFFFWSSIRTRKKVAAFMVHRKHEELLEDFK